jgi:hypothetical protein
MRCKFKSDLFSFKAKDLYYFVFETKNVKQDYAKKYSAANEKCNAKVRDFSSLLAKKCFLFCLEAKVTGNNNNIKLKPNENFNAN